MGVTSSLINNPVVKREIKPASTVQPTNLPAETIEGLPFYYYLDQKLAFTLIGIGIIYLIVQIGIKIWAIVLLCKSKKFICTKCKKIIYGKKNPKKCPACDGIVVPIKEYSSYKEGDS